VTTIFAYSLQIINDRPTSTFNDLNSIIPYNMPLFFGVAVFNFEGNAVILSIHKSMK